MRRRQQIRHRPRLPGDASRHVVEFGGQVVKAWTGEAEPRKGPARRGARLSSLLFYAATIVAVRRSAIVHGLRAIPAAMAGVMRMLLCIRQKL